jgi:hypothetical protein
VRLVLFLKLHFQRVNLGVQVSDGFIIIMLNTAEMIDFIFCRVESMMIIGEVVMLPCEVNANNVKFAK